MHLTTICCERQVYENGLSGYCITPLEKAAEVIEREKDTVEEYGVSIREMLALFGDKSAKELELLTTIIYIYSNYKANQWDTGEVPENVHEIKPHFDIETIKAEYEKLDSLGILERSIV